MIHFAVLLLGMYPGITQVNNYWHHASDVVTGLIAGTLSAILNYNFVDVS